jgi:hypothetical protein
MGRARPLLYREKTMKKTNKIYQFGNRINKQFYPEWGELDLYYIEGKRDKTVTKK